MSSYYHKFSELNHLYRAWRSIPKRAFSRGFDEVTIEQFRQNLDANLRDISNELRKGGFTFTPARGVALSKPEGGKRPIKVPAVRDRVVLKAIQLLIEHKFRKFNLPCSFGYVPYRSVPDAIARIRQLARDGNQWVLEADISKFFDTVDRDLLIMEFTKKIRLPSLLPIIEAALNVEVGNLESFFSLFLKIIELKDKLPRNYHALICEKHPELDDQKHYDRIRNVVNLKQVDEEVYRLLKEICNDGGRDAPPDTLKPGNIGDWTDAGGIPQPKTTKHQVSEDKEKKIDQLFKEV